MGCCKENSFILLTATTVMIDTLKQLLGAAPDMRTPDLLNQFTGIILAVESLEDELGRGELVQVLALLEQRYLRVKLSAAKEEDKERKAQLNAVGSSLFGVRNLINHLLTLLDDES